jgi:drug/metabolite transporter (DMT)-like permease
LLQLPLAMLAAPAVLPGGRAWLAAVVLGVVCTAGAYIMYFRLVKTIGPTRAITVTYAIPAFGILWGHVFLQEPVTMLTLLGAVVIVLGTAMVNFPDRRREAAPAHPLPAQALTTERC